MSRYCMLRMFTYGLYVNICEHLGSLSYVHMISLSKYVYASKSTRFSVVKSLEKSTPTSFTVTDKYEILNI